MSRKVVQFKGLVGWNRAAGDDIAWFMRKFFPSWPDGHLREAVRYLIKNGRDLGVLVRFERIGKCREESWKPFTSTEKYFRALEDERFIGTYGEF